MKTLLTLIVLLFSSSVVAEDISDFQIEGMSVGDSLLDYLSEEEIKDHKQRSDFKIKKYIKYGFHNFSLSKKYESINFYVKKNDKNYQIQSITGHIYFLNNIEDCYKLQNVIDTELDILFRDFKNVERYVDTYQHAADDTGKSKEKDIMFEFDSGDVAGVACLDFSKEIGWDDELQVFIDTKEYNKFLSTEAW